MVIFLQLHHVKVADRFEQGDGGRQLVEQSQAGPGCPRARVQRPDDLALGGQRHSARDGRQVRYASSVFSARWIVWPAIAARLGHGPPGLTFGGNPRAVVQRTSYMTSPTCTTFSPDLAFGGQMARGAVGKREGYQREMRSVRMRFTSSGMRRLNERRPASTWATGIYKA